MTDYAGLCVKRFIDGAISGVRVRVPGGQEIDIDVAVYIARHIQPPISSLPDCTTLTDTKDEAIKS